MDRRTLGELGEEAAAAFLIQAGYIILDQNWRADSGEIDLVARIDQLVVFVEVRTRASSSFGSPEESLTQAKADRLLETALTYLENLGEVEVEWRLDFIAVECDPSGRVVRLDHYPGALTDFLDQR